MMQFVFSRPALERPLDLAIAPKMSVIKLIGAATKLLRAFECVVQGVTRGARCGLGVQRGSYRILDMISGSHERHVATVGCRFRFKPCSGKGGNHG
jgi:hypothetical protein